MTDKNQTDTPMLDMLLNGESNPAPTVAEKLASERADSGAAHLDVDKRGAGPVKVGGADGHYAGDRVTAWQDDGFGLTDFDGKALDEPMPPERVEDAIRQAGADWQASLSPVQYMYDGGLIRDPHRKIIVRGARQSYQDAGETDPLAGTALGVIGGRRGSRWEPLQPASAPRLVAAAGCPIARIGEMRDGAQVYAQSPAGQIPMPGGDTAGLSLFAMEDLTGSGSFQIIVTATIAACRNYIKSLIRLARKLGQRLSVAHNASAEKKLALIAASLRSLREAAEEFSQEAMELAAKRLKDGDLERIEEKLFGPKDERSTRKANQVEEFRKSYTLGEIAEETERNTLWGAYMGVTHFATHKMGRKQGTDPAAQWLDSTGSRAKFEAEGAEIVEELLAAAG